MLARISMLKFWSATHIFFLALLSGQLVELRKNEMIRRRCKRKRGYEAKATRRATQRIRYILVATDGDSLVVPRFYHSHLLETECSVQVCYTFFLYLNVQCCCLA